MENTSNILVIGGTGKTGRKVVDRLNKLGHNVRIGSRSANPAFDWDNSQTWSESMQGMDKVYITFQPDLAVPGALEAIEELTKQAKRCGVKKLVLLSGKGEREAELCEQVVIHSGLDHTIVRASWFNQNFSESFFLEPFRDAIQEIAEATNRNINFTPITLPAYTKAMKEQGVPADFVWLVEYLFSEVLGNPSNSEITNDVETVLGRKAIDFTDYVNETVKTGVWTPKALA